MHVRIWHWIWLLAGVWLTGCNLFSSLQAPIESETNAAVLISDGKSAAGRGDYAQATRSYERAMAYDPRSSEARVGYAEAYLKSKGFSVGAFLQTLLDRMQNSDSSSGQPVSLLDPADWGAASLAEVKSRLTTVLAVLSPISQGLTSGPYGARDFNVNLNAGLFHLLKVMADVETLTTAYTLRSFTKGTPEMTALNLPPEVLSQLPDEFQWFADSSGHQPSPAELDSIDGEVSQGLAFLRTAESVSHDPKLIREVIDMFDDWDILASQ